jgi:hypothetical protein
MSSRVVHRARAAFIEMRRGRSLPGFVVSSNQMLELFQLTLRISPPLIAIDFGFGLSLDQLRGGWKFSLSLCLKSHLRILISRLLVGVFLNLIKMLSHLTSLCELIHIQEFFTIIISIRICIMIDTIIMLSFPCEQLWLIDSWPSWLISWHRIAYVIVVRLLCVRFENQFLSVHLRWHLGLLWIWRNILGHHRLPAIVRGLIFIILKVWLSCSVHWQMWTMLLFEILIILRSRDSFVLIS